ncbi:MAG: M48 family metalloprotease [Spirochaetales bacterium]|nr:M48 family metalloprotease [Spirochaetales bacterium]
MKRKMNKLFILPALMLPLLFFSCDAQGDFNFFSLQDDVAFGEQLHEEILANPEEYPVLERYASQNNQAIYTYVEDIMNRILESNEIYNRDVFEWQVTIIDKDVLNAFAAPGGYLYFYTGFLNFAGSEAELAGVMAHEIAHSDRRHSTDRMTKVYGIQILWSILLGEEPTLMGELLANLTTGLGGLAFTRDNEYEADEYALRYMYSVYDNPVVNRNYELRAMQDFFNRMEDEYGVEGDGQLDFLRTHPYNDDREANMTSIWEDLGSPVGVYYTDNHNAIKLLLQ